MPQVFSANNTKRDLTNFAHAGMQIEEFSNSFDPTSVRNIEQS